MSCWKHRKSILQVKMSVVLSKNCLTASDSCQLGLKSIWSIIIRQWKHGTSSHWRPKLILDLLIMFLCVVFYFGIDFLLNFNKFAYMLLKKKVGSRFIINTHCWLFMTLQHKEKKRLGEYGQSFLQKFQ